MRVTVSELLERLEYYYRVEAVNSVTTTLSQLASFNIEDVRESIYIEHYIRDTYIMWYIILSSAMSVSKQCIMNL